MKHLVNMLEFALCHSAGMKLPLVTSSSFTEQTIWKTMIKDGRKVAQAVNKSNKEKWGSFLFGSVGRVNPSRKFFHFLGCR